MPQTVVHWRVAAAAAVRGGWPAGTGCMCLPAGAAACTVALLTAARSHSMPTAGTTSATTGEVRPQQTNHLSGYNVATFKGVYIDVQ